MRYNNTNSRQILSGAVALTAIVAASLMAPDGSGADNTDDAAVPAAPAPLTGIRGPALDGLESLDGLETLEFIVPVLARPELRLPDIPEYESAWIEDGIMPAPTTVIDVDAPDVEAVEDLSESILKSFALERPEFPTPPPVR